MTITKVYKVTCNKYGQVINRYICYKLSLKELRKDSRRVRINNGNIINVCENCVKREV